MKEIARKLGISQATVSRVLNGHSYVSEATRKSVMDLVAQLDYRPNRSAQVLARAQSFLIGVILPDLTNPYFYEIVRQIERECTHNGYNIILCNSEGNAYRERSHLTSLRSRQVDGLLIGPSELDSPALRQLAQMNIPAVVVTREHPKFDSVSVLHQQGGALVARHFVDLGRRQLLFVGSREDEKFMGFRNELRQLGCDFTDDRVVEIHAWEQNVSATTYERTLGYFRNNGPKNVDAVFAYNDVAAFAAFHALNELGIQVPSDIALAGFDDTFIAQGMRPSLTSVAQPTEEIGRAAVEILIGRLQGKTMEKTIAVRLPPRLVARESTRGFTL